MNKRRESQGGTLVRAMAVASRSRGKGSDEAGGSGSGNGSEGPKLLPRNNWQEELMISNDNNDNTAATADLGVTTTQVLCKVLCKL